MLTHEQDIPSKEVAKEPWTIKRLFQAKEIAKALANNFKNPLEIIAMFLTVTLGLNLLIGRHIPSMFYVLTIINILAIFVERNRTVNEKPVNDNKNNSIK